VIWEGIPQSQRGDTGGRTQGRGRTPSIPYWGTSGWVRRIWAIERGGADSELDAERGRGVEAPQSGADQPPDRPGPAGQPRDRQDPRSAHNLQAWSVGQDPGRSPRHRVRNTLADWGRGDPSPIRAGQQFSTLRPLGFACQHGGCAALSAFSFQQE
jgi:hypothetical protein